jgi:hypothetical protein
LFELTERHFTRNWKGDVWMSRREHLWIHEEFNIEELSEGLMLVQGMSKRGA